ncbi:uncharacterized protein LOC6569319 [Drosophila grimshawi]|uniref:GH17963 n=1 Tax=Drosophila grimshawi TaxID=7222 RepID=B4JXI5_DROGR|nr:uncharacterized protein LOC6569319 [Drosophila grimshawi]EDV95461.1 GH17963 [Drosophila grimshawi]
MKLYLATLLLLLLLICCSLNCAVSLRHNLIKVRATGFLPFESDLVLPLGILRQLEAQERSSRVFPAHARPLRWRTKTQPRLKGTKGQVRLERAHSNSNADPSMQMYNLIDDDGELLLNMRVHHHNQNNLDRSASWRPSKWRPTTSSPLAIASSSPRPLPLHQYLNENRRIFGGRQDWIYK